MFDGLKKLSKRDMVSFHVPGHKNGKVYEKYYSDFVKDIGKIDITEIPGSDNFYAPQGIIKHAQERASRIYGSEKTFFLVNGTTCGIYSMIMAATKPGDKIIIPRDCHKSVYNGLILGDLTPIYIKPEVSTSKYMSMGITPESIEKALKDNPEAKAVVITYPNYYGMCSDIKEIARIVHNNNKVLLVDEAHGAHLGLSDKLPISALEAGADIVVQSTHKTLPSFTQSSMLHVNSHRVDIERLKFMLALTQSSSPSYILMTSLDIAMTIVEDEGKFLMDKLLNNIDGFRKECEKLKGLEILSHNIIGQYGIRDIDSTKLTISMLDIGINGTTLDELLRTKYNIQIEMANIHNVLLVSSIGNDKGDFQRLSKALNSIYHDRRIAHRKNELPEYSFMVPELKLLPKEAINREREYIPFVESKGRISGEFIIPYPPGIPLIAPGEIITEEIIEYVELLKSMELNIIGTNDVGINQIGVIK